MRTVRLFIARFLLVMVVVSLVNLCLFVFGVYAETETPPLTGKGVVEILLKAVLPALAVAAGPTVIGVFTALLNKWSVYVPRWAQTIVAGLGAVLVAQWGGGDPSQAMGTAVGAQTMAQLSPEFLRTSAPPEQG